MGLSMVEGPFHPDKISERSIIYNMSGLGPIGIMPFNYTAQPDPTQGRPYEWTGLVIGQATFFLAGSLSGPR